MINVQIGGGLQPTNAPVENLGKDLAGLFSAVANGVDKYNTIGETAAKLKASEDIAQYREKVTTLKASLAYADKNPDMYLEVNNRINELGSDLVAKSLELKDHKAAYDVYKEATSAAHADVASVMEPLTQAGFVKEGLAKKQEDTAIKQNNAGLFPSKNDIEVSRLTGASYGQGRTDAENDVAKPHLDAIDAELNAQNPSVIASKILTGGAIDRTKLADYLNTMTGSLVKYVADKDGHITLDTPIESASIKEQYMKRLETLVTRFTKKEKDVINVAFKVMKENVTENKTPTYTIQGVTEKRDADIKAFQTYVDSDGYANASKIEEAEHMGIEASSFNDYNEKISAINAMQNGDPITKARFSQVEVVLDENNVASLAVKDMNKQVSETTVNGMITSYSAEIEDAIKNGTPMDKNIMGSMIKSKPANLRVFEDALLGSINSGGNLATVESLKIRVDSFNIFSQKSNSLANRAIYADASRFLGRYLDDYNKVKDPTLKSERGMNILAIASAYQSTIPTKIQIEKIVTATMTNEIYKKLDIEGVNIKPDNISESFVEESYYQYRNSMNRDPSTEQLTTFIDDNAVSMKRVFNWDRETEDIIVLRPVNSNGQRITSDNTYYGLHSYIDKHNMNANDYNYITTSTTGKSTAIQIVDKKTGALYAILNGDYFDRESKYNTKKVVHEPLTIGTGLGSVREADLPANIVKRTKETQANRNKSKNVFGTREDGTNKGNGWLGVIPFTTIKDGKKYENVMTEKSITVNINGKDTLIPSIVPTLTKQELEQLKSNKMPKSVVDKAVAHARIRMKDGKSPFKD